MVLCSCYWWEFLKQQNKTKAAFCCSCFQVLTLTSTSTLIAPSLWQLYSWNGSLRSQKNTQHHGRAFNILIYDAAFKMRYYPAFQKNRVASLLSKKFGKWPSFKKKSDTPAFCQKIAMAMWVYMLYARLRHKHMKRAMHGPDWDLLAEWHSASAVYAYAPGVPGSY
jgi:hypothetical protein